VSAFVDLVPVKQFGQAASAQARGARKVSAGKMVAAIGSVIGSREARECEKKLLSRSVLPTPSQYRRALDVPVPVNQ